MLKRGSRLWLYALIVLKVTVEAMDEENEGRKRSYSGVKKGYILAPRASRILA
jgi:hypothetical protein